MREDVGTRSDGEMATLMGCGKWGVLGETVQRDKWCQLLFPAPWQHPLSTEPRVTPENSFQQGSLALLWSFDSSGSPYLDSCWTLTHLF